jgi:hypothetical protein
VIDTKYTKDITFMFNNRPFSIPVDKEGQVKWLDKLIAALFITLKLTQSPLVRNPLYTQLSHRRDFNFTGH